MNGHTNLPLIAATPSGESFGRKIAAVLAQKYLPARMEKAGRPQQFSTADLWVPTSFHRFANGDAKVHIGRSIRDANIYVVADLESHATPTPIFEGTDKNKPPHEIRIDHDETRVVQDKEEEIPFERKKGDYEQQFNDLLRLLATTRSIAGPRGFITAVVPLHPSSRQDRRQGRYSLDLKERCVHMESAGVNHVLCIDIHDEATELAYALTTGFDHLYAAYTFLRAIRADASFDVTNMHILSPDAGAFERNLMYATELACTIGQLYKRRDPSIANAIDKIIAYAGDVHDFEDRDCLSIDDLIDTAKTLIRGAKFAMDNGARSFSAVATHPVYSDNAIERLDETVQMGRIHRIITTNAVSYPEEVIARYPWWTVVDISPYFGKAIDRHNYGESLSELLKQPS